MPDFRPSDQGFARWQVLELTTPDGIEYLRVTHIFDHDVYVMRIKETLDVRHARRPIRYGLSDFMAMSGRAGARWGRISMPPEFISPPPSDSRRAQKMEVCWQLIEPLVELFESSTNLNTAHFTSLIRARAEAKNFSFDSARRLLLRYYYFGGTKYALLPFHPGT